MANYFLVFHVHCIPENPNFHSSLWRPYSQELGQAKAVVSRAGQAWGCWSCAVCPLESLGQVMAAALVSLGLDCLKCTCSPKKLPVFEECDAKCLHQMAVCPPGKAEWVPPRSLGCGRGAHAVRAGSLRGDSRHPLSTLSVMQAPEVFEETTRVHVCWLFCFSGNVCVLTTYSESKCVSYEYSFK